jgi:hypothetical protein
MNAINRPTLHVQLFFLQFSDTLESAVMMGDTDHDEIEIEPVSPSANN